MNEISDIPSNLPIHIHALSLSEISAGPLFSFVDSIGSKVGSFLPNVIGAIAILILFWIAATIAASVVKTLLSKTKLDNKLASWLSSGSAPSSFPVEKWTAAVIYWVILLFGIIAFLNALDLAMVSAPLSNFLDQIFVFLPKVGGAALWLGVAWVVATLAKVLLTTGLSKFKLDDKLAESGGSPFLVNETLANALYWFIFLLFLPNVLDTLGQDGLLTPLQAMLEKILSYLPNVFTAVAIAVVGWFAARIIRGVVTNLLAATGTDTLGNRFGLTQMMSGMSLSAAIGTVVYVIVLIPIAISALDALNIKAISEPAIAMLESVMDIIPKLFSASFILAAFFFIGRFISEIVTNLLTSFGFDNILSSMGINPPTSPDSTATDPSLVPTNSAARTPSEFVGIVIWVGIMLFATIAAVDVLDFSELNAIISGLTVVFGQILSGAIVLAIGLYLANLAFGLIVKSGLGQAHLLGQIARVAIIVLSVAMGLQQMGIAPDIVNLAFGLLLGALAVATAIAFGLGGREIATEQIRSFLDSFKK
ncbi:MAG: mechanosensitive ion channel [Coleofasciculaceae cyanobacterium RL_1_1]|nr:mechanosensitive ion channel [Coleofasciculaceae cyanobacterium RL_1_1]